MSDNGTQFTSAQSKEYCKNHATEHVWSPPYHPQSNDQTEKFVNTLKRPFAQNGREGRKGRINKTIPYHIQDNRPPKAQWKVTCRSIDGKNCLNNQPCVFPRATSNKPEKLLKRITFNVGDPLLASDFRPGQTWTADTVARRHGSVLYEIRVNGKSWIRHRNQPKRRQLENPSITSIPLSLLFDTFKLPTQA